MAQYADIISVQAPNDAYYGEQVNVSAQVKNLYSAPIGIMVVGVPNYTGKPGGVYINGLYPNENKQSVNPGVTRTFSGYFTMPNAKVTVVMYSYWYGTDGIYHLDDDMSKVVNLKSVPASQFGSISVTSYTKL